MSLKEKSRRLIEEYSILPDSQERFAYVMDQSIHAEPFPDEHRTDENRVFGCVSKVWILCEYREGRLFYFSDADSPLVKGIVWLLTDFYSGAAPDDIIRTSPDFLRELRLLDSLTENRRRGVREVIARIQGLATDC